MWKRNFLRCYSTLKPKVIPDEETLKMIDSGLKTAKNHPGIIKPRTIMLPESLIRAIEHLTKDSPVKALQDDCIVLTQHLKYKQPPPEKNYLENKVKELQQKILTKRPDLITNDPDEMKTKRHTFDTILQRKLKSDVYNWKPVTYDAHTSLLYLFGRVAADYAVLSRIFMEISKRDPKFKPRSLFDFGSGVGTVTWAAIQFWKHSIYEYFNVDVSADMNDLAQLLLQDGRTTKKISLKGVFYRQFLPASHNKYDLVVSAYTLMELPSRQSRYETLLNLWNKTNEYLVIVEEGTIYGFQMIHEARNFILNSKAVQEPVHIFAPCPHEAACPRFTQSTRQCYYQIKYSSLPVHSNSETCSAYFSYVVFKKGERDKTDPQWPRIVENTLWRSKHAICRMCTKEGELKEVIFTKSKHGKTMYHCARSTKWGDLLPITLEKGEEGDHEKIEDLPE